MRQKVGKERSQGVFAPLAIPRLPELGQALLRADASGLCKEKPSLRVPSGTDRAGDAEHRNGLRKNLRPKLGRDLPMTADTTRRTGLLLENRDLRSRAPPPPPAEGATSLLLRRLRGRL